MRSSVTRSLYRVLLKPAFFQFDPEDVHDLLTDTGALLGRFRPTRLLTRAWFGFADPALRQNVLGIDFPNPIGLAAGFDKDGRLVDIIPSVGFGFMEVGSVTGEPCAGNPKPRLWRLKKSKSIAVYYGLKNDGCETVAKRLRGRRFEAPVGISVAKTNCAATADPEKGIADYEKAFRKMADVGDYVTVNISCPNAYGGQPFTDASLLDQLLTRLDAVPTERPVFLKLSPDLDDAALDALLETAAAHRVHGLICSNLTKDRSNPAIVDELPPHGGLSGKVVEGPANSLISRTYLRSRGRFVIVGCGGVSSAEDAYKEIRLGASLIQMITGMIFEGPQVITEINRGLVKLLKRDGFRNVSEAVGAEHKTS